MLTQFQIDIKSLNGKSVHVRRIVLAVHNDYELETFIDDLRNFTDELIDVSFSLLVSSVN